MAAVAAMSPVFEKLETQVAVISVDSPYVHKAWSDQELLPMLDGKKIPFAMVSDQNGEISKAYGVYSEDASVSMRGRFIIDPEGNVQSYEVIAPAVGRNFKETIRTLQALKHVHENSCDATPAGWEPGKAVLKPSIELSGNVHKEYNPNKY